MPARAIVAMALAVMLTTAASSADPTPPSPPSPLERARACHGDNACVVRALASTAASEQELAMLAVTYRLMDQRANAIAVMRRYLRAFPNGPQAASFHSYCGAGCGP